AALSVGAQQLRVGLVVHSFQSSRRRRNRTGNVLAEAGAPTCLASFGVALSCGSGERAHIWVHPRFQLPCSGLLAVFGRIEFDFPAYSHERFEASPPKMKSGIFFLTLGVLLVCRSQAAIDRNGNGLDDV